MNNMNGMTGRNGPEKRFVSGAISASVWNNHGNSKHGAKQFYTVSCQRSYKDKNDEWKTSNSLRLYDIPKMMDVLQKAYEYMRHHTPRDGETMRAPQPLGEEPVY